MAAKIERQQVKAERFGLACAACGKDIRAGEQIIEAMVYDYDYHNEFGEGGYVLDYIEHVHVACDRLAERVARTAHADQVDKSGAPYVHHVRRVSESFEPGTPEHDVAWLHDVLEDTPTTPGDLARAGIPDAVIGAVAVLTRLTSETYREYIARVAASGNLLAIRVKVADLRDHLRDTEAIPESLAGRYARALLDLGEALIESVTVIDDVEATEDIPWLNFALANAAEPEFLALALLALATSDDATITVGGGGMAETTVKAVRR